MTLRKTSSRLLSPAGAVTPRGRSSIFILLGMLPACTLDGPSRTTLADERRDLGADDARRAPVDFTHTTAAWEAHGEPVTSPLGAAVAVAGDVNGDGYRDVLVASSDNSRVELHLGSAAGVVEDADVLLEGEDPGDDFGISVATAGDVDGDGYDDVVIGASARSGFAGSAYLYPGGPTGLSSVAATTWTGEASGDRFGTSVSAVEDIDQDGYDDVVVGAPRHDSATGRAYVYLGSASGLGTTAAAVFDGTSAGAELGSAVSGAGDVDADGYPDVAIGAPGQSARAGAAYVYTGSGAGLSSTPVAALAGSMAGSLFGSTLAAAGDVDGDGYDDLLVGAYGYNASTGRVYVYPGSASGTETNPATTLTGEFTTYQFGRAVSAAGDQNADGYADIAVGEPGYGTDDGRVIVYPGSSAGTLTTALQVIDGGADNDAFGSALAGGADLDGDGADDLVVGAPGFLDTSWSDHALGAAFVYVGGSDELVAGPTLSGASATAFGWSMANAGDVNGDGFEDAIIGGLGYRQYSGETLLFLGSAAGLSSSAAQAWTGAEAMDCVGHSVAGVGDVNGDGFDDVMVGAYNAGEHGEVYIYLGAPTGPSSVPDVTLFGDAMRPAFGSLVAGVGDVNGDGYDDVGVALNSEYAYVFPGSADGVSSSVLTRVQNDGSSIMAIAAAGDVNGDGYADVLVADLNTTRLYAGSGSGLYLAATIPGPASAVFFGYRVAGLGDVDQDGYDDFAVSDYSWNSYTGRVYIYRGSSSFSLTESTLDGSLANEGFGLALAAGRDLDGDGFPDLLVGGFGELLAFRGSATGLSATPHVSLTGDASFGETVDAGDFNGDGSIDILVADPAAKQSAGAAYVFEGYVDDDEDGVVSTEDCDDDDATVGAAAIWYADADGDGFGDASDSTLLCVETLGYASNAADCDDADPAVNPDAAETCDDADTDENCNGLADDGDTSASGQRTWYEDADGDGSCGSAAVTACDPPVGACSSTEDCDDDNAAAYPGAEEIADDGVDQDCDGVDAHATADTDSGPKDDLPVEKSHGCAVARRPAAWALIFAGSIMLMARRRRS